MTTTLDAREIPIDASRSPGAPPVPVPRRSSAPVVAVLAVAATVVVVANRWGEALLARGVRMQINTPPLTGMTDWRPGRTAIPAVIAALVGIAVLPVVSRRMRWPALLAVAFVGAIVWAGMLALVDGREALTVPLLSDQYLRTATQVGDPLRFLRTFVDHLATYNIHTQGHPPGMVMLLWAMDRAGLGGVGWNATLVMAGGGAGVVAALVGVREVAGEALARAALPLLVLAPAAISWTSGDALFTGVGATAVSFLLLATGRHGRVSDLLAGVAGVLFAAAAFLSYGLVLLAVIPLAVAWSRRRFRPVVVAGTTAVAVGLLVGVLTGFSWWAGLVATHGRYYAGVAQRRPYDYFLLGDLAVFALMVGPAALAGLTRVRRTSLAWLVAGAVAAVVLADLSGMAKAEVERIWLPFVPWVLVAGAAVAVGSRRAQRAWLAAQVLLALLVAVTVRSPW